MMALLSTAPHRSAQSGTPTGVPGNFCDTGDVVASGNDFRPYSPHVRVRLHY
jgi:hypothetical protein